MRKHEGESPLPREVTLGKIAAEFREIEFPNLSESRREAMDRHLRAFIRGWDRLGPDLPAKDLSESDWKAWIRQRINGQIDCHGEPVPEPEGPEEERSGVTRSTVAFKLASVKQILNWATTYRVSGEFLLEVNPARGFKLPKNPDPARPVASDEKYFGILSEMRDMEMSVGSGAEREKVPAHAYPPR